MNSPESTFRKIRQAQIYISIFILALFSCSSIAINYYWIKDYATQNANFIHRHASTNDKREVGLAAQEAHLNYFTSISYDTTRPGGSFTFPPNAAFLTEKSFFSQLSNGQIHISISKNGDEENIIFTYNRFRLLPYAFSLWLLLTLISIPQIRILKKRLSDFYAQQLLIETDLARAQIANKVRHNIRTPLSVLMSLSTRMQFKTPEETVLFQGVISQVQTLISELDTRSLKNRIGIQEGALDEYLCQALKGIRETLPANIDIIEMVEDCTSANITFIPHELKSILENLINNSVEASATKIQISLNEIDRNLILIVEDNGKGMSPEVLLRVSHEAFSHGKENGSGLGLKHTREQLANWNGQFNITSTEGSGSQVRLSFPIVSRAKWFIPEVKINNTDTVIVIDDQVAIHRVWQIKLSEASFQGTFKAFFSVPEAEAFLLKESRENIQVFADFDLGDGCLPGIVIFERFKKLKTKMLVTGHSDLEEIKQFCIREGVALLPKTKLSAIPISVTV